MSDGRIKIDDGFYMGLGTLVDVWGLTEKELRGEMSSGRLVVHGRPTKDGGYSSVCAFLPSLLRWVARKRLMPAAVRAKVEAAGGLDRVERFRMEQLQHVEIHRDGTVTMPDGSVMTDVIVRRVTKH